MGSSRKQRSHNHQRKRHGMDGTDEQRGFLWFKRRPLCQWFMDSGGKWLSPLRGVIITSTNGTTWRTQISTNNGSNRLNAVYYANDLWVAVGNGQYGYVTSADDGHSLLRVIRFGDTITTSTDGATWTTQPSNVNPRDILYDVHYDNNLWVAVGSNLDSMYNITGAVTTSRDGITWSEQASDVTSALNAVHYDNNLWVAVGEDGAITTSANGTSWMAQTSNVTGNLNAVHYDNNLWVAVGDNGTITTSANGTEWTSTDKQCDPYTT